MRMYQAAEALVAEVDKLLPRAKKYRPNAARHLEKSLDSLLFNMGEGIGIYRAQGKIGAYEISRKETNEVRTVPRRLVIAKVFTQAEVQKAIDLAGSVVGMLTAAIISLEKRVDEKGPNDDPKPMPQSSPRPPPP